VIEHNN